MRRNIEIDVRPLLSAIDVPTMVIHNDGDPLIFTDRGAQELRGGPGEWDLYPVSPSDRVRGRAR